MEANSSGIFSCFGYISLYLFAASFSLFFIVETESHKKSTILFFLTLVAGCLFGLLNWIIPTSRRVVTVIIE